MNIQPHFQRVLNSPVVSLFYKDLSAFSSFEDWLTALPMKLVGGKYTSHKSPKNPHKVNWHNPLKQEGPRKKTGTQDEKQHEVKGLGEGVSKCYSC